MQSSANSLLPHPNYPVPFPGHIENIQNWSSNQRIIYSRPQYPVRFPGHMEGIQNWSSNRGIIYSKPQYPPHPVLFPGHVGNIRNWSSNPGIMYSRPPYPVLFPRHIENIHNWSSHRAIMNSKLPYPVPFPGHMENINWSSNPGIINSKPPLEWEEIEIPEPGNMHCYSGEAESSVQSTSPIESSSHQLQSLKSFEPATENACEMVDQVAENEIDEFLKNVAQKHGCSQIGSEMKDLGENCSYTCSSRSEAHSSISNSHTNNENYFGFITTQNKRYDSDENSSCSFCHSLSDSAESVTSDKIRKTSYKIYKKRVSSDESITEQKSKTLTDKFRKGHSTMHTRNKLKREHSKIKRVKKTVETETKSRVRFHSNSNHPPLGVNRKKTGDTAVIQRVVEHLKYPCVGLDKVTEIQGLDKTHYYCELCSLPCSFRSILSHLESFKHRMQCLKAFAPHIYECYSKVNKYEIEHKVNKVLKYLVDKFKCGKIRVEKEYPCSLRKDEHSETEQHSGSSRNGGVIHKSEFYNSIDSLDVTSHSLSTDYNPIKEVPGISESDFSRNIHNLQDQQIMNYQRSFFDYDRNIMSYNSKFYCDICHISMYNINNWEMHMIGGRHIINAKKARGEFPFRRKPVLVPNARSVLMRELDQIREPVVGLDMIKEIQDSDAPGPMYSCSPCKHNTTSRNIINHILSQKHRLKFLQKIGHHSLHSLKKESINSFDITNICAKVEAKQGRGYLSVYVRSAEFDYRPYTISTTKKQR